MDDDNVKDLAPSGETGKLYEKCEIFNWVDKLLEKKTNLNCCFLA